MRYFFCLLTIYILSASAADKCAQDVLRGLDSLLGVCGAYSEIKACAKHAKPSVKCSKVLGPGGNLITQDITEDITLGEGTPELAAKWHQSFTKCAKEGKSLDCTDAVNHHGPVLHSVQGGLAELVASKQCDSFRSSLKTEASELSKSTNFVNCGHNEKPETSEHLIELVRQVRRELPPAALAKFPLHGVVAWAEPNFALPEEEEEEEGEDEDEGDNDDGDEEDDEN